MNLSGLALHVICRSRCAIVIIIFYVETRSFVVRINVKSRRRFPYPVFFWQTLGTSVAPDTNGKHR